MYDIYVITNKKNNKKYVGFTSKGFERRFKKHVTESKGKSQRYLCRAIRKYGENNFDVQLIEQVKEYEEAIEKERYYIDLFKTFAHKKEHWGYNATLGGEGADGLKFSNETKRKLSYRLKELNAWKGKRNPKFGKGHLMCGEKNPNFGKKLSESTKKKISDANRGKNKGNENPSSVNVLTYSLNCETGEIMRFDSFFNMRKHFENKGISINRSTVLKVIRGEAKFYKDHIFYRGDITPSEKMKELEYKFKNNIRQPIKFEDHRQGKKHPNAKNILCFAKNLETSDVYKFNSWFELKNFLCEYTGKNITYSNMSKVLKGVYNHTNGFVLYREDITKKNIFEEIKKEFTN